MGIFDNDADIETAQLNAAADHESALKRKGICAHGWLQNHPDGTATCKDCGKVFASFDAACDERADVLD